MDCTAISRISLELGAGSSTGAGTSGRADEHAVTSDCMEDNKGVDSDSKSGYRGRKGSSSCTGVELRVGIGEGGRELGRVTPDQSQSTMGNNEIWETVEPSPGSPVDTSKLCG